MADYIIRFLCLFIGRIDAELLVWYAADLDSGRAPRLAAGGRFVFVEAYRDADAHTCDGHELFLYQEDSGGNGGAARRGIYYRMSIKGDRQNADYFYCMFFRILCLPLSPCLACHLADCCGGTMIVETVFSWNGIGQVCTTAISARDYSLIQGYTMWMGFDLRDCQSFGGHFLLLY